jgi:hypothetical protein
MSQDMAYNAEYQHGWIMSEPGASKLSVSFFQPKTSNQRDVYSKATLRLVHLSPMQRSPSGEGAPTPGRSPISIVVNGKLMRDGYEPVSADYWTTDDFDVTHLMRDGSNLVEIQLEAGATADYWILEVRVICV